MTLHSPISSIYCSPLSAGLRSAAASTLSPSVSPLSTSTRSWICFLHKRSRLPCGIRNKKPSPDSVYSTSHSLFRPVFSSPPLVPVIWFWLLLLFFFLTMLLPRRLPLRSDLGKWNVVIEEKVQIGSGCKWSLVSGRRLCSQTGVWSFKGEKVLHQVSAILWLLAPGARVWVTDYKTALSGPSHFNMAASHSIRHAF